MAAGLLVGSALAGQESKPSFKGKWDLTVTTTNDQFPSWIEVSEDPAKPSVRIVGRVSSVHPAEQATIEGDLLTFMSKEHLGKQMPVIWELNFKEGHLTGVQKRQDGTTAKVEGKPAPALARSTPPIWSRPQPLFNGKDLTGWEPFLQEPGKSPVNHYVAKNGELVNEAPGANIRTTRKFNDFKLHLEYNCPEGGNSGVYLRGRYEIQVEYEPADANDPLHGMGSVYGFLKPSAVLPQKPGEWESFDITLVGRFITMSRDGQVIHNNEMIPGITGGALESDEGIPGPIYIQGDHTGGMKYRNITIAVPEP